MSSARLACANMNGEVIYGRVNNLPVATPLKSNPLPPAVNINCL